jgi:aldehyde:ferredoxin oxidoreductase
MARYGYHGCILHVNLTEQTVWEEEPSDLFYRTYAGGGLLGTYYLLKETPPGLDAFDPDNRLIFTSSVVAGFPAAGLPRFSVCAKSPLTGGIGETRCEGPWGIALKKSGYDALIFSGAAAAPVCFVIDEAGPRFISAAAYWGKTVGETCDLLEADLGTGLHIAAVGPAGERRVRFASVVADRSFQAPRMGMGAVMGAKNLKAIALRGGTLPDLAQPERVEAITQDFEQRIAGNPLSTWQKQPPGFAVWIYTHGLDAALDVENYRTAQFAQVENYQDEKFLPYVQGHLPCPGCPNDCIKVLHADDPDLDPRASGIHQEVTGALGPNVGLADIRVLLRLNNLLNQWGMDPVSLGFTLSMAMELRERGLLTQADTDGVDLRFGEAAAIQEMARRIAYREGFGDVLAEGSRRAAEQIGGEAGRYALHVKGLEMVPFEPRSQTNLALGFAVAPIGPRYDICEHDWDYDTEVGWEHTLKFSNTVGVLERIPMAYLGRKKVRNFKALSALWSGADALDMCIFAVAPTRLLSLDQMAELLAAVTGWETSAYEIMRWGERRLHLMRVYNNREGLGPADDRLPDRFHDEAIASGPKQGQVLDREQFQAMIRFYYEMMGWDEQGQPRPATLYDYSLEWTLEQP